MARGDGRALKDEERAHVGCRGGGVQQKEVRRDHRDDDQCDAAPALEPRGTAEDMDSDEISGRITRSLFDGQIGFFRKYW